MDRTCNPSSQDPVVVMKFEFFAHSARLLRKLDRVFNREKFSRGSRSYLVVTLVTLVMSICYKWLQKLQMASKVPNLF